MEQNINIAALLKDCPKGTKLYSPICGECELEKVYYCSVNVRAIGNECAYAFQETGKTTPLGECLLFPSKKVRDWNLFRAKFAYGGADTQQLLIANGGREDELLTLCLDDSCVYYIGSVDHVIQGYLADCDRGRYIISTGTELKLEEEQPKFKVGDVIRDRTGAMGIVKAFGEKGLIEIEYPYTNAKGFLLPASLSSVTPEEIKGWNEKGLHPKHHHYSTSKRKIIDWFLPFDKCLMRDKDEKWIATLFSHFSISEEDGNAYVNIAQGYHDECIPYNEKTAKLIGTTDDWKGLTA